MITKLRTLAAWGVAAALGCAGGVAVATQWDMTSGDFHTHLMSVDGGFQLHIHDKATHSGVDTSKGKVTATLLAGGKTSPVPITIKQVGVIAGSQPLAGDWVMLFRVTMPGMKPAQIRYSSKMKPGGQDAPAAAASKTAKGDASDGHDPSHH